MLFGQPYGLSEKDCVRKWVLLNIMFSNDNFPPAGIPHDLLIGCVEGMRLVQETGYHPEQVCHAVQKRLQDDLLMGDDRLSHTIGIVAGAKFCNSMVKANTAEQTRASLLDCLNEACSLCLTLEQEFRMISAPYRQLSAESAFAAVVTDRGYTRPELPEDPGQQEVTAVALTATSKRQRTT